MRVSHHVNVNQLVARLLGSEVQPEVAPWRSQLRALSQAITFVENDPFLSHEFLAHPLLFSAQPAKRTRVIGLTGLPGSGKSSLTNLLISQFRAQNKTVAVLAVDPSSALSGGAILGDRVRMQDHFKDEGVFIRSMGARGALGGLSKSTRAAVRLIGLLNFDVLLLETVGIGQSESDIVHIADTTVLVLMPNSGDEIQLMKAGVLQLANIYVVNKCDLADPSRMIQELKENFSHVSLGEWLPPVLRASASQNQGLEEIASQIWSHRDYEESHPLGRQVQLDRARKEVLQSMLSLAEEKFQDELSKRSNEEFEPLLAGKTTAFYLAKQWLS
jgi:LAO/AO transport system kinase